MSITKIDELIEIAKNDILKSKPKPTFNKGLVGYKDRLEYLSLIIEYSSPIFTNITKKYPEHEKYIFDKYKGFLNNL